MDPRIDQTDHLISMSDGKPYKMLKRHLSMNGYTPENYRQVFDLPINYQMTAANYAAQRSELAKKNGLGRKAKAEVSPMEETAKADRKRRVEAKQPVEA